MGRAFVEMALEKNYQIVMLARDPSKVTITDAKLEVMKGDAKSLDDVKKVVNVADVVVMVVGGTPTSGWVVKPAVENVLASNPKRVMVLSSLGVNGSSPTVRFLLHDCINRAQFGSADLEEKSLVNDLEQADTLVQQHTGCPWVLVRPTYLEDHPAKKQYYATAEHGVSFWWMFNPLSKADVAKFFVDHIEDNRWDRTPVHLHTGDSNVFDG